MATYYVQPNGSDSNTGLGATNALAWRTIQKALSSSGIGSGDTLYIAPGTYRETITIAGTYSATTTIIGDRTSSQFSSVPAGYVRITGLVSDALGSSSTVGNFTTNGKSYLTFNTIWFEHYVTLAASTTNTQFAQCQFTTPYGINAGFVISLVTTSQSSILFDKCYIQGAISISGSGNSTSTRFNSCLIEGSATSNGVVVPTVTTAPSITFSNCTFFGGSYRDCFRSFSGGTGNVCSVYNSLLVLNSQETTFNANATGVFTEDYNAGYITRGTTPAGANSKQLFHRAFVGSPVYINPIDASVMPFTPLTGDSLIGAGSATYSFGTDYFGNAWANPPSIGAMELKTFSSVGAYLPSERNASTITIAPGSTSQSIELYLGATGLTASTSGLSARYNRTRTASVSIPLVARTIAQAWTAGGFAEVDATNMPGVYRLDLPDAALAAGADDVTIVVRGASGTNGAVMTVKLSSGGLTEAQTASAVWGASPSGYNDSTTFGGVVNETNQLANSLDTQVQDVPSNVWEEMRATHTTAGTFGEYVNAELVTPVTSAALVRMGPYEVKADGLGASDPLDIQKGAQHGVDIQCVDGNGNGIDITSATVTAKVYNSGGSLVDTYSCTATYAADGRATFTIDTTVTNTPGTYTATITRTTGASDTQVFGPLRIYVRDI